MSTGADIPPELIQQILFDICENASGLLDPYMFTTVANRKEAIKNITACLLTCVYWARICREKLFQRATIKNYEDMRAFVSLVVNTPTRFMPISKYVKYTTLVQHVGDRPWLHLLRMQPSLFQFWRLRQPDVHIYSRIEDSPNDATSLQSSTSQRLFASLPRTPPSSCLRCDDLTIDNPHFVTPHDLVSFLQKFSPFDYLCLTNVAWSAKADFASDLLARHPLNISFHRFSVEVHSSKYTAETTWLALTTMLRYSFDQREVNLQVLPSARRAIVGICKCLCQGHEAPFLRFYRYIDPWLNGTSRVRDTRVYWCCNMEIEEYEPTNDRALRLGYEIQLAFYGSQMAIPATDDGNSLAVDCISVLCVRIKEREYNGTLNQSYPWAEVAGLCAAQEGFIRMQLQFESHECLVEFMEAQRAALGKLHGRITLFYYAKDGDFHAADFETLADVGDASAYGYIKARLW